MHGKGEFSKIKENVCNIPTVATNIYNVLPRPSVSNGLIVIKLKRNLKYRGHECFKPVRPRIIYQAHNKFYKDIPIVKGPSSDEMFKFSSIIKIEGETKSVTGKIISNGKKLAKMGLEVKQNLFQLKIPQTCTELHQMRQQLNLRFLI